MTISRLHKSEIRNPNIERNPKPEFRSAWARPAIAERLVSDFGSRHSFGSRISDFGFHQRCPPFVFANGLCGSDCGVTPLTSEIAIIGRKRMNSRKHVKNKPNVPM